MNLFTTRRYLAALPLLQGCMVLNNDGLKSTDGAAGICGVLGVICVLAGLFSHGNTVRLILVGAILIIA